MLPNAFIDKGEQPTDQELTAELGRARPVWDQLLARLAAESGVTTRDWHSYSRKAGWALRLKAGQRTILYLSPCRGCFRAAFVLGAKAVDAARHSDLPPRVIQAINEAKKFAEGTGIHIDVNGPKDISAVLKLAALKLEH